jgi:NADPH-dependent 2,4-dienoyl-CoA reductase/sulfur reductase-like enzyme
MTTIVVVGGDAAGMSAASKVKRELEDADVIVFEKSETISYSACGMPYWIAGVVDSEERLLVMSPEKARAKRGLDVRIHHEVTHIDRAAKTIEGINHATGATFSQPYDKLMIATGARAVIPPIPGMDLPGVFTLRAFADSQRIQRYLAEYEPTHAVVIGGGYIGIEMAEALRDRELDVHIVEMLPQLMPNFDADMVSEITEHVQEQGVTLHLNTRSDGVERSGERLVVKLSDGSSITTDMVIVSVGVRPNSEIAKAAGLAVGKSGAITVDAHMQTSDPDIYAAGDCVEYEHIVLGGPAWIPLAPSANKGGRVAGDNISGGDTTFPGILGTAVVKVFDYTMSVTGLTEAGARGSGKFGANGEDVGATITSGTDRAGYWPGAAKIRVKLVFQKSTGKILGAQLVGKAGVNKRIDIVAAAISGGLTVRDLGMMDLSYAPPFSPTYDPLQVCANVAEKEVG